jgi:hypothetical protein
MVMNPVCAVLGAGVLVLSGCGQPQPGTPLDLPVASRQAGEGGLLLTRPAASQYPHLHNLLRLSERIYSGGEPVGDEAFGELARLGVKVVVSVDGARPNVDAARKQGLRYVHIPIGYDGIPDEAGLALARVAADGARAGETLYFHCHHGKHRGPAAAAAACIADGVVDSSAAGQILEKAGTSQEYAGLWRDVASYQPPSPGTVLPELVEVAEVDSMVAAMSQIDHAFDNLKLCQAEKWATPADHPDIVAVQESLLVKEGLHEAGRTLAEDYDEQFIGWLREAEGLAEALERQLKAGDVQGADRTMIGLDQACKRCHVEYRN